MSNIKLWYFSAIFCNICYSHFTTVANIAKLRLRLKTVHETSTFRRVYWDKCALEQKSDFRQKFMEKIDGNLENCRIVFV